LATHGPDNPLGLPSPQALKTATDAVARKYVLPETLLHPVVQSYIIKLAGWLTAYGLVPTEPDIAPDPVHAVHQVGRHLLVVDDTADVRVTVGAFLAGAGFVVASAPDGDAALRLIAGDPEIGVLITDYAMPGLTGVELIALAAEIRPDLRALLITAYPSVDGLAELPSHIKLLTKPFRRAALIAHVKTLVGEVPPMPTDEAVARGENRRQVQPAMRT
jgi:CheY-like chemotaxis protein